MMQIPLPDKELLRPDEVAASLEVSRSTIYLLCQDGTLERCKVGRQIRISREAVLTYLRKTKEE